MEGLRGATGLDQHKAPKKYQRMVKLVTVVIIYIVFVRRGVHEGLPTNYVIFQLICEATIDVMSFLIFLSDVITI